jgi:hypothetical protein
MSEIVVNRTTKQLGRVSLEHDTAHREPNEGVAFFYDLRKYPHRARLRSSFSTAPAKQLA